jgi:hypothetical protein
MDAAHRQALPDVDGRVAPLPTLVAVGSQPGRHLLVDLERLGHVHIGGDPDRACSLVRYITSELACNSWSDDIENVLAGFAQDESELLVALSATSSLARRRPPGLSTRPLLTRRRWSTGRIG